MTISTTIIETLQELKTEYPDAHCALEYETPFQLLIATALSAQCTDERVNIVTKKLFASHPDPETLAAEKQEVVEKIIHSTGFYRNKAKNIRACSQDLVDKHNSQVPSDMDDLTALAGVGRKTANVVLGEIFKKPVGVVVDTHVKRLSRRLGWTEEESPVKIEKDLMNKIPKEDWIITAHLLISHGRKVCDAKKPLCSDCFLEPSCPSSSASGEI